MKKNTEKELQKKDEWKKKKTGEIIFPNEKCNVFHRTTVTLG